MAKLGYTKAEQEALIKGLVETGNKLLNPPSSIDQLLIIIQNLEILLAQVYQNGPLPVQSAILPAIDAVVTDELMGHTDPNVQFGVAACTNELIRITAPIFPYNDDLMKRIFKLQMVALQHLSSEASTNYIRAYRILRTMACFRSCLIMLDLQIDEVVVEMFQIFLDKISAKDPDMFDRMKTVMTLVIEESDDISLELLRLLLSRVKMDNKDASPLSWELARSVFETCAPKFQQYVRDAVKEMNLNIADYDKIIASMCQDTPFEAPVEADTVDEVANVQLAPAGVKGTYQAAQEDSTPDESENILNDENLLEAVKGSQQTVQPESNNARSDVEVDKVVESPKSKSAEAKNPGDFDSEEEKGSMEVRLPYGPDLVNRRVKVWWPLDKTYYTGTVEAFFPVTNRHRIKYDDDEEEVLDMLEERWELFTENQPRKMQTSEKQEAGHPSPTKETAKSRGKRARRKVGSSSKHLSASSSKRSKGESQ